MPIVEILYPDIPQDTPKKPTTLTNIPARLIQEADQIAAQRAWKYFGRNWNPQTGLVNSVDHLPWTTWWD
ncbi:MAG: DUF3131 domain-containing protein [Nodularia sp. (in: Bacteria)]|nr:MAG: DUF3131 domain-containing protein [Nodularia sp. (in: cyanobacteria)]